MRPLIVALAAVLVSGCAGKGLYVDGSDGESPGPAISSKHATMAFGDEREQVKFTLEKSEVDRTWRYDSGALEHRADQKAYGLEARKILRDGNVEAIFVGGMFTNADGERFGTERWNERRDGVYFLNETDRRIIGGEAETIYAGARFRLGDHVIRIEPGYERLTLGSRSFSGPRIAVRYEFPFADGTASLKARAGESLDMQGLEYERPVSLLKCGTIGTRAERIDGHHGLRDDNRAFITFRARFGEGECSRRSVDPLSLKGYTKTPVVRSYAALSIKGQETKGIVKIRLNGLPAGTRVIDETGNVFFPHEDVARIEGVRRNGELIDASFVRVASLEGVRGVLVVTEDIPVTAGEITLYTMDFTERDGNAHGKDTGVIKVVATESSVEMLHAE